MGFCACYTAGRTAHGMIQIPISVLRNGQGPTALFTGANHGDEYEGPIALQWLAYNLRTEDVSGRVMIIPYMNYPALHTAKRLSPMEAFAVPYSMILNEIDPVGMYDTSVETEGKVLKITELGGSSATAR